MSEETPGRAAMAASGLCMCSSPKCLTIRAAAAEAERDQLRAQLATAEPVAVVASRDSVSLELAAAMAETRGMREKLTAEAHRLDAAAAKAEKARDGSRDGTYRLMLDQRAEWCREQAAVLRGIAGIGG